MVAASRPTVASWWSRNCRGVAFGRNGDRPHDRAAGSAELRDAWPTFSPDGSRLVVTTNFGPAVHVWDLRTIRKQLVVMGLDWDAPLFLSTTWQPGPLPRSDKSKFAILKPRSPAPNHSRFKASGTRRLPPMRKDLAIERQIARTAGSSGPYSHWRWATPQNTD